MAKAKISNSLFIQLSIIAVLIFGLIAGTFLAQKRQNLNSHAAVRCGDSDGGYDIYANGTITGPNLTTGEDPVDYCIIDPGTGEEKVVEYGCSRDGGFLYSTINPDLYSNTATCQVTDGSACVKGACYYPTPVPGHLCEKDDSGDIYTKGHLISDAGGTCYPNVDMCLDDIDDFCVSEAGFNLIEFTCERPSGYAKSWGMTNAVFGNAVNCPYGCSNGACIEAPVSPTVTPRPR